MADNLNDARQQGFTNPDDERPDPTRNTPSRIFTHDENDAHGVKRREQVPVDPN